MSQISIPAHFDGNRVVLDDPVHQEWDTPLVVTVLDLVGSDRQEWHRFALAQFARAYGPDEPEYGPESIREMNPDYDGREDGPLAPISG